MATEKNENPDTEKPGWEFQGELVRAVRAYGRENKIQFATVTEAALLLFFEQPEETREALIQRVEWAERRGTLGEEVKRAQATAAPPARGKAAHKKQAKKSGRRAGGSTS